MVRSIFWPAFIELTKLLYASSLKNSRAVFSVKTLLPNIAVILGVLITSVLPLSTRFSKAWNRRDIIIKNLSKEKNPFHTGIEGMKLFRDKVLFFSLAS